MRGVVVAIAMLACAACTVQPESDREVRLRRLEADHRALLAQLEDLQARLLVNGGRIRFWEDMRGRHESVSAIACTTQDEHAMAMAVYLERAQGMERGGAPATAKRQARVASLRQVSEVAATRRR